MVKHRAQDVENVGHAFQVQSQNIAPSAPVLVVAPTALEISKDEMGSMLPENFTATTRNVYQDSTPPIAPVTLLVLQEVLSPLLRLGPSDHDSGFFLKEFHAAFIKAGLRQS